MAVFTVGDHEYRSEKLDALVQFHISRRLTGVVIGLAPLISLNASVEDLATVISSDIGENIKLLEPVLAAVAKMSDEDVNYVVAKTMAKVYRAVKNPGTGAIESWSPMWSNSTHSLMYDDLNLSELVQIVWYALRENLEDFSFGSPSRLSA